MRKKDLFELLDHRLIKLTAEWKLPTSRGEVTLAIGRMLTGTINRHKDKLADAHELLIEYGRDNLPKLTGMGRILQYD